MVEAAPFPDAPESRVRVVIVDADHRVRDSLAEVVSLGSGLEVVGAASHLTAAVTLINELRPDVVILDPRLPDLDGGIALVSTIRQADPSTRILLMTWSLEHESDRLASAVDEIIDKCASADAFVGKIVAAARPRHSARC
jgi:two-component system response regulator DevR